MRENKSLRGGTNGENKEKEKKKEKKKKKKKKKTKEEEEEEEEEENYIDTDCEQSFVTLNSMLVSSLVPSIAVFFSIFCTVRK